ncbi:MAG: hypothetical protein SFW35_05605 [Chitinophagales bacterium]|nr:hypothetical protein [Chitinophagales bacterium]
MLILLSSKPIFAQHDSLVYEAKKFTVMAGSRLTVPEGQYWTIEKVTCSGGSYAVRVKSLEKDSVYAAGQSIVIPTFVAEAELLSEAKGNLLFTIKVKQYFLKPKE